MKVKERGPRASTKSDVEITSYVGPISSRSDIKGEPNLRVCAAIWLSIVAAGMLLSSCAVSQKAVLKPAQAPTQLQTSTKTELIDQYNQLAISITALNASVTMKLSAGSAYTGAIEQYHEVNGFILAQKPSSIRVVGQAPVVGTNIFDMESDGKTFDVFIPSKNRFVTGPDNLERSFAKPIENLRPQHLIDAIFWQPIPSGDSVLLEVAKLDGLSCYVLIVAQPSGSNDWQLAGKIWFERTNLNIVRIEAFDTNGKQFSDVRYGRRDTFGNARYPSQILLIRAQNDYQLQIVITKLTLNETIEPDRFVLKLLPGSEIVNVGEAPEKPQP